MLDGFINLVDGRLDLLAGQTVVPGELVLEIKELVFEVRHVDALLAGELEFLLHGDGVPGGVDQEHNQRLEELGTDDEHLRISVRNIHDAGVVELAVGLQERHEYGILAAFRGTVGIELIEEVLVLVLGGRLVLLVLHLEHDRDILDAIFIVAEDEIALAAFGGIVVLFEVGVGEHRTHLAVEYGAAVGLQALADHLGRQARLEVLEAFHLFFGESEFAFILVPQALFAELGFHGSQFFAGFLLSLLLLVQFLDTTCDFVVEFSVSDLVDDGSVVGIVHREYISALGASEFFHIAVSFCFLNILTKGEILSDGARLCAFEQLPIGDAIDVLELIRQEVARFIAATVRDPGLRPCALPVVLGDPLFENPPDLFAGDSIMDVDIAKLLAMLEVHALRSVCSRTALDMFLLAEPGG